MTEPMQHYTTHRAAYHALFGDFKTENSNAIIGVLSSAQPGDVTQQQIQAWEKQVTILKQCDIPADALVCFEYLIPRMGKRIDNVVITDNAIFALEFKVGSTNYDQHAKTQAIDYALDLKNFHQQSRNVHIIPILVATEARPIKQTLSYHEDKVATLQLANATTLSVLMKEINCAVTAPSLNANTWFNSVYEPTPTIIEASQALYTGHDVTEISRSEAGATNLSKTSKAISKVIEHCKTNKKKAICFVTGIPGAGKTLAGLNLACDRRLADNDDTEHAVFLSGNGPLVNILQEALARDTVERTRGTEAPTKKSDALRQTKSFIQNIHHFRDEYLDDTLIPIEKVTVFDEAQRAWNAEQASKFMKQKRGIDNFNMSEPEYLINVMDRHEDWATVVCLIGHGQEINTGEAGIAEWFRAIEKHHSDWEVHAPDSKEALEILSSPGLSQLSTMIEFDSNLHLSASVRSFRSEHVSDFVAALLEGEADNTQTAYNAIKADFPIVITRSLDEAKDWIRSQARGSERYGLLVSSGARRLKALGLNPGAIKDNSAVCNWFLNEATDVRSSYYMEDPATEFETQGLELDWTVVVWDGDLTHNKKDGWNYKQFKGSKWQNVKAVENQVYRMNAYRVLLTRARQGMVVVVPEGSDTDQTRLPERYDPTWEYLLNCSIPQI